MGAQRNTMIELEDYAEGTPEKALAEFVLLWKKRKWEALLEKCQLTWRSHQWPTPPQDLLRLQFAPFRLVDAKIGSPQPVTEATVDIGLTIDYELGRGVATRTLLARVIRESAPMTPDVKGAWGVNPTSLQREV